jgi:thiosulfate/3-mercaptopyruvate sulfurtransferase
VTCQSVLQLVSNGARPIQVDLDPTARLQGQIPGATSWLWEDLRDAVSGDILTPEQFAAFMGANGIKRDTLVLLYGDMNNWFAAWAYWLLKYYGHENVRMIDGGLTLWLRLGLPLATEKVHYEAVEYSDTGAHPENRASIEDVFEAIFSPDAYRLLDVRSSAEYEGQLRSAGVGTATHCQASGHIPTAINIPWNLNCNPDGTLKPPHELRKLYAEFGVTPSNKVITYCAIGERASISWFVLKELLGFDVVMNYDGSMSAYTKIPMAPVSSQAFPIDTGHAPAAEVSRKQQEVN